MKVRAWWWRLRGSLRRDTALEREMEQEMAFHLEMATRRNLDRGMNPAEARRQAKLAFGSAEVFKEEAREARHFRAAESLMADVRFALRSLRRSPSFTIGAVLTLGLGIGASTAMFTVLNAVLLRPLPIPEPENFTYVGWEWSKNDYIPALTDLQYQFVRDHSRIFDAVAAYRTREARLGDDVAVDLSRGLRVSSGFFRTIGFHPGIGRAFNADELKVGGPPVAILSDDLWRTRFAGDSAIIGRQVRLDGEPHTVVGVLPAAFRFPPEVHYSDFLVPLVLDPTPSVTGNNTDVIGRLRVGTSVDARTADLRALSNVFRATYPSLTTEGESFRLFTHIDVHVGNALRRTVWVLYGAVSLVLLIACANTATLLLVRASARQREIAVRLSIGAGPGRILQQLLTEGLVLSSMAAALGVLSSVAAVRGFLAVSPVVLPAGATPAIDGRVLGYALAVSMLTGLTFGLVGAVPARRPRLQSVLLSGGHGSTNVGTGIRETLVFLQTIVAVVLLAGAVLLIASFVRLVRVDPGFDADRVIAVRPGPLPRDYDPIRRELLVERLLARVRSLPGVEDAAIAPNLPLERGLNMSVDTPERPGHAIGAVELRFVSPRYLATLAIPLRAGRDFNDGDAAGAEPVAIVNEAFARHFWGNVSPLGRTIQVGHSGDRWLVPAGRRHPTRVVGVAADIQEIGLDRPARATVLLPRAQSAQGMPVLLVRGAPSMLLSALRAETTAEEPRLAPTVERLSAVVSRSVAEPRFRTLLIVAFAGVGLLLTAIGIYGVIASAVQLRQREIALRLALGANAAAVSAVVVRRCLANVTAGTVVGLFVFWAAQRVFASWLYDISPADPRVLAASVAVLMFVAAFASWIPARRATRIDPATALRLE